MRRTGVAGAALIAAFISMTCTATASTVKVCVPKRQGAAIVTPSRGRCRRGYALAGLGPEGKAGKSGAEGRAGAEGKPGPEGKVGTTGFTASELETLKALLPHIRFSSAGVDGKPTVQFTGVNVQVVNGAGKTATANGEGNLIIGYDENEAKHEQSGSHDLVLGEEQTFTSFGGLVAGWGSSVTGSFASVTGGEDNSASGDRSSVSGGSAGTASGAWASVSGGYFNHATASQSSVSGGAANTASEINASVSGGESNTASNNSSSVSGGEANRASGNLTWVGGGRSNHAEGAFSSIFGGKSLTTTAEFEAVP